MTERITISVSDELAEEINSQLEWGDNRSEWIRDAIQEKLDRADRDRDVSKPSGSTPEPDREKSVEPSAESSSDAGEIVAEVADSWDDTPERLDARRLAAEAVVEAALERGEMSKRVAVSEFYDEYPVSGQNEETWWRKNIRPILQEIGEWRPGQNVYDVR